MRLRSCVRIGALGLFALAAAACSGGTPAQGQNDLPAAVVGGAAHAGALATTGAHRSGSARRSIPGCTGSGSGSFVGANNPNVAAGDESGVVSGISNDACDQVSGIFGGNSNTINSSGAAEWEFIGAGSVNAISAGNSAFIGAGQGNTIGGAGTQAFIGAGWYNSNTANNGVVAGGQFNGTSGAWGSIGGGYGNKSSGQYASIAGGNSNTASGTESTVAGGGSNIASGYASFAAGYHADAAQSGSFVWSDNSSSATTKATVANQFVARTAGGVKFFSNSAMTTGVSLAAGGGSWGSVSDRAVKTSIAPIDDAQILDRVAVMPISEWSYISERGVRHVGPMAQDFYAAFGIGEDNKHITSIDEDGVALAAIKALHRQVADLKSQLAEVKAEVAALRARK